MKSNNLGKGDSLMKKNYRETARSAIIMSGVCLFGSGWTLIGWLFSDSDITRSIWKWLTIFLWLAVIIALFLYSIFDEQASLEADINKATRQREGKTEKISAILDSLRDDSPISDVYSELIAENIGFLLAEGVHPDICVKHMRPDDVSKKVETLLNAGATPSEVISRMYADDVRNHAWKFLAAGVDPELIKRWI